MSIQTFSRNHQPSESDDSLYFNWLRNNPRGFVMAFTLPDEYYVTLHKAKCTHILRQRRTGAYTRGNYGKHCSSTWEAVEQFKKHQRARIEECRTCSPTPLQRSTLKSSSEIMGDENKPDQAKNHTTPQNKGYGEISTEKTTPVSERIMPADPGTKKFKSTLGEDQIQTVAEFCRSRLNLSESVKEQGDPYQCVPVCVIDAVFSIGVRYSSTEAVVRRFCTYFDIPYSGPNRRPQIEDQLSLKNFLDIYDEYGIERMTREVYQNRQRTSSRGGILKSDAVLQFSQVLSRHTVNYLQDVDLVVGKQSLEFDIMQIPGQRSGISLRYFYMLIGNENFIKPDRMIRRFLYSALGRHLTFNDCHDAVVGAQILLVNDYHDLTPKSLDHLIWLYERSF